MRKEKQKQSGNVWQVLRYFFGIVRKEKPSYFLWLLLGIVSAAVLPFVNIIVPKYLIDELVGAKDLRILLFLAGGTVACNWMLQTLSDISIRQIQKLGSWFNFYFERRMAWRGMTMDFPHTENPEMADQVNKAADGMRWYSGGLTGLTECVRALISSVITICGVVTVIALSSPLLLVIAILAVAGSSLVIRMVNKIEIDVFQKGPRINRGFGYVFWDLPQPELGKDIRLYRAQKMLMELGRGNFKEIYQLFKGQWDGTGKWSCVNVFIGVLKNIGIFLYLGYLLWQRLVSVGDFMMLMNAANCFKDSLQEMITQMQQLQKKANFMGEYRKFMELPNRISQEEDMPVAKKVKSVPKIEFRHVSFAYPGTKTQVLRDVSLVISPGEHLSVVGLNGAGKTTFIKLLCRLYDVDEGEILVGGIDIRQYHDKEYRALLSVVFQDFQLFAATFGENICMGNWERTDGPDLVELCKRTGLSEKVESLPEGLDTALYQWWEKNPVEPSGGEAQKIAIARALYKDAPVVVLDEPTAALDPVAEYEVYRHFDALAGGKSAVYISHRLSSCQFCDRIAVFADHTVAEYGTHDELVKKDNGIYAGMFAAQAQYYV